MKRMKLSMKGTILATLAAAALACGGPQVVTEKAMLDWGNVLNLHLGTGGRNGDYSYPRQLSEVDAELRAGLSDQDAWGNDFYYRRLRDDRYQLVSAGPDGELGNDDDVVMANSKFMKAAEIYAKDPLEKGSSI
ncbi:MAG TPA: hypothetical protein VGG06_14435 [Thermoanaerobaculia bacterium]